MKFQIKWTEDAVEQYKKLKDAALAAKKARARKGTAKQSNQEGLFKQVAKTLKHLGGNPKHPGLATHEYTGIENPYNPKERVWEAYAQNATPGAYRVFWCYGPKQGWITIIAITPHP